MLAGFPYARLCSDNWDYVRAADGRVLLFLRPREGWWACEPKTRTGIAAAHGAVCQTAFEAFLAAQRDVTCVCTAGDAATIEALRAQVRPDSRLRSVLIALSGTDVWDKDAGMHDPEDDELPCAWCCTKTRWDVMVDAAELLPPTIGGTLTCPECVERLERNDHL